MESVPGPDDDDRVHAAAAVAGGATVLITDNLGDFDSAFLASHHVIVETAESYLLRRLEADPVLVVDTIKRVVALKTRPTWTFDQYLDRVDRAGAPRFSTVLRIALSG